MLCFWYRIIKVKRPCNREDVCKIGKLGIISLLPVNESFPEQKLSYHDGVFLRIVLIK